MKKSIRILSILMAFAMLIGNFSVMGSAYHAYKGEAIQGIYNDVDSPEFSLDQYASMALDEVDRMLAKEQLKLDLLGLLKLDLTSIDATITSVLDFLNTGASLIPLLGDAKTLPNICAPLQGVSRGSKSESKKDIDVIYALLDFVANLRDIAHNYVAGTITVGILDGFIADYKFDVRELAIGLVFGMLEEGKAIDYDYMDDGPDAIPAKYAPYQTVNGEKVPTTNAAINILQTLLLETVLGEWMKVDELLTDKYSATMPESYKWTDINGNVIADTEAIDTGMYDYYAWVHEKDWVTVALGGAIRVSEGAAAPAATYGPIDITTDRTGYEFVEELMQTAYNYIAVPVLNRDTVEWALGLCGYTFDETKNNKTLWAPLYDEVTGEPIIDEETGEQKYGSVKNLDYDPDYHGDAPEVLSEIAALFKHEEMHAGSIKVTKEIIPAGETFVDNFNNILGRFITKFATNNVEVNGTPCSWTWIEGGNDELFDNIVSFGKYVLQVTGDLFFSDRAELPSASEIAEMDGQAVVALIMREILNNSVDYVYVDDSYNTIVDVAFRATEQLAWQDIPQFNYVKPDRADYEKIEDYYYAVVDKMIDILFDIAVYNLNQGFDMDPANNGSNPITDTGLLQYQDNDGSYENNLIKIVSWAVTKFGAVLNIDFQCDNGGTLTIDDVWMDIDSIINSLIPIKGSKAWINSEISGDGTEIVSRKLIFDHILKPLYTLDATNFALLFEKNPTGSFATKNGVEIIVELLNNVFNLIFPNVFQPQDTLDEVLVNGLLADMVFDLIGSLGYSSFTNANGTTMPGRGANLAATALPVVCMLLGLADDQEFEEMEIYLPATIAAGTTEVKFDVVNGSSGINTGYTDKNGNFTQDALYTYVIDTVNVYTYDKTTGSNTNAITHDLAQGTPILGGDSKEVKFTSATPLAEGTLIEFVVDYNVLGESGTAITDSALRTTVYSFVGSTDKSDDEIEIEDKFGDTGRSLKYEKAIYLDGGDDLDDLEGYMIRVQDNESKEAQTANVTGVSGTSFVQISSEAKDTNASMTGEKGVYFLSPFEIKTYQATDEETGETYDKAYERKEPIYEKDEDDNIIYDEETGEPNIIGYTDGIEDGEYSLTTTVNVAGSTKTVTTTVQIYDDYGLESAFERAVAANRQLSAYNTDADEGAATGLYLNYIAVLKDVARFVLKPKKADTFQADIVASSSAYDNKYEELAERLEDAIEALEVYEKNSGITAIKTAVDTYSAINYEYITENVDAPYKKELEYYDEDYEYFGMRDYVPHTYNRYKDALSRANGLIESQELCGPIPFSDEDVYGKNYEPTVEELENYNKALEAYAEAVENQAVVGAIESAYAIHMLNLTGSRLIRLEANTSKLQNVYDTFAGAVPASEEGNYTVQSLTDYRNAEAFALRTLNTSIKDATGEPNLAPSQVNRATTELIYAWKHLAKGASYSALDAAIAAAEEKIGGVPTEEQSVYSEETYAPFYAAYVAATTVDRDLSDTDDNNNLIAELTTNLTATTAALALANSGDPVYDLTTEAVYADIFWSENAVAPLETTDPIDIWGEGIMTADGETVTKFLYVGQGVFEEADVLKAFGIAGESNPTENVEIVVTPGPGVTPDYDGMYGSGTIAQVYDKDGVLLDTYAVIIRGEMTNDGSIDTGDAEFLTMASYGFYEWWTSPFVAAGDINNDYSPDTGDAELLTFMAYGQYYYDIITGDQIA